MNDNTFGKIFLGGSKTIGRLPDKVASYLDLFMESNEHFLIGDCHGADLAIQNYLFSKNYTTVTIYCSGEKCRFNVGTWPVKAVLGSSKNQGYDFYHQKDMAMIEDCDGALLIWDTHSAGTKNNINELKNKGLPIFTYRNDIDDFRVTRRRKK